MKSSLLLLALFCFYSAPSHAVATYDGCYQLYTPGSLYPTFCLDGTTEEGIGGAGARFVLFHVNSDIIEACGISSGLNITQNSFEYIVKNKKELILSDIRIVNSRLEGTATVGNTQIKFMQHLAPTSKRLLQKFYAEPKCQDLNVGQLIRLHN